MNRSSFSLAVVLLLAGGCCFRSAAPAADSFDQIEELMTQDEVLRILGPPPTKRSANFPAGQFMGPQEGMIGVIAPGQPYEEWEYVSGGEVLLIFFAGRNEDDPPNQWNVVGKTQYPVGAVF